MTSGDDDEALSGEDNVDVLQLQVDRAPRYKDLQREKDAEYRRGYAAWLKSLAPDQRERIEALGLTKSSPAKYHVHQHERDGGRDAEESAMPSEQHPIYADESAQFQLGIAAQAMTDMLQWLIMPPGQRGLNAKAIGCRAVAMLQTLKPGTIPPPDCLKEIAESAGEHPWEIRQQTTAFLSRLDSFCRRPREWVN